MTFGQFLLFLHTIYIIFATDNYRGLRHNEDAGGGYPYKKQSVGCKVCRQWFYND